VDCLNRQSLKFQELANHVRKLDVIVNDQDAVHRSNSVNFPWVRSDGAKITRHTSTIHTAGTPLEAENFIAAWND
jgi:hypothetical protein